MPYTLPADVLLAMRFAKLPVGSKVELLDVQNEADKIVKKTNYAIFVERTYGAIKYAALQCPQLYQVLTAKDRHNFIIRKRGNGNGLSMEQLAEMAREFVPDYVLKAIDEVYAGLPEKTSPHKITHCPQQVQATPNIHTKE